MKKTLFLLAATTGLQAAMIFDSGSGSTPGAPISSTRAADSFSLSSATVISSIQFYWTSGNVSDFSGTMSYAFYADAGGVLGALQIAGHVDGIPSNSLPPVNGLPVNVSAFNLSVPLGLPSGNYWLELREANAINSPSGDGTTILWMGTGAVGGLISSNPSVAPDTFFGQRLAFQLFDTQVAATPEPSTLVLSGLGLVVLCRRRCQAIQK